MSQDRDTRSQPSTGSDPGDGSLDEALDDLESIIGQRDAHESPSGEGRGDPPGMPSSDEPPYARPRYEAIHHREFSSPPDETPSSPVAPNVVDASAGACDRVAERLASEVEVIVNARLESAVREALDEVHREVRNHIAIVLPELLDEILGDDEPGRP